MKEAKSDKSDSGMTQIPLEALAAIGQRFKLGEAHYGRDNWKLGGDAWFQERDEHALIHLLKFIHQEDGEDTPLQNLAAVAWWAMIRIWHLEHKQAKKTTSRRKT